MDHLLQNRIQDAVERTGRRWCVSVIDFLDPATAAEALAFARNRAEGPCLLSGGYEGAERQALFLLPPGSEEETEELVAQELTALRLTPADHKEYSHRDYLGSLMGLGLSRAKFGDIVVTGDRAVLFCFAQTARVVLSQLDRIAGTRVSVEEIALGDFEPPVKETVDRTATVMSLRADSVTAEAFSLSRTRAAEIIRQGNLTVNWAVCDKVDRQLAEGDMLAIRGMGRARLAEVGGTSRKGRLFITIRREK